ncbi:MAG: ABC transporter permease, partial [Agathobacter sp.]
FLERFPSIWSRLSFLNKVTVRNLFRYKKRLFMTLFGIAGCTSLLVAGFTIKDTVTELMYKQYGDMYVYDSMVIAEDQETLLGYLEGDEAIRSFLNMHISNVKLINEAGKEETIQIMVVPEGSNLRGYVNLRNVKGDTLKLEDGDVYVTINATNLLGVTVGDMVSIQTLELDVADAEITDIAMNYIGNCVYMTQGTYEELFGVEFEGNAALVRLKIDDSKHEAWGEALAREDGILSAATSAGFEDAADQVFRILNLVVYIIITLAAALAFVVLFTLATTNISERERELATIKVLGFFDKEVHAYVNKETLILTSLGIAMGLPIGKIFGEWLMSILNMPSIYFAPNIYPISFVYSAGLAIIFAFMVNFITDKSLNRIDPVEALKSIE